MLTPNRTKPLSLLAASVLALALAATPTAFASDDEPPVPASPTSTTVVTVDQPVVFNGKVAGPDRTVLLQRQSADGWHTVDSARSDATDAYTLDVPTWWYGQSQVRAYAPAMQAKVDGHLRQFAAVTSTPRTVQVNFGYTPEGTASQYKTFEKNARWNPCVPITWAYNASNVPDPALDVITQSVKEISRATGIRFKYVGTTTKVPWRDKVTSSTNQPADLIIAWATPQQVPDLSGSVIGFGGSTRGYYHFKPGTRTIQGIEYTNGGLVLDKTETWMEMSYSSTAEVSWGQTVRHEIGHVLGLDHVDAPQQTMYPMATLDNEVFGAGDYAGLRALGAQSGCWAHAYRTAATSNHGSGLSANRYQRAAIDPAAVPAPMPGPRP